MSVIIIVMFGYVKIFKLRINLFFQNLLWKFYEMGYGGSSLSCFLSRYRENIFSRN